MPRIPFTLNNDLGGWPTNTFIRSKEEFDEYLSNPDVFSESFTDIFRRINEKYDASYFAENDLLALIIWATSTTIYGYSLDKAEVVDWYWNV